MGNFKRYPRFGERVRVNVDPTEPSAQEIVKFNGKESYIDGIRHGVYTIEGFESNKGVKYWFHRDWLDIIEVEK